MTQSVLAEVSRQVHWRLLKSHGFRRLGNHMHRRANDLIHGVHFQANKWGTAESGSFTLNLVVTADYLYTPFTGRPLPANPATAAFPLHARLGFLLPEHMDRWWPITPDSDPVHLGVEVADALHPAGLAFFDRLSSSVALLTALRTEGTLPGLQGGTPHLIHAMLAAHHGHREEATAQLTTALAVWPIPEPVRAVARRLGLELPPE